MTALKFTAPDTIEGPGIPFGGPFAGKDLDGEYFAADTDLCLDWFGETGRPILYHHGASDHVKTAVVGRQTGYKMTDDGIWVTAELDKAGRYRKVIGELIEKGALGFSSGSMPHLVQTRKDGHIERWPWVELSLTTTPANPDAVVYAVKTADALEHLAAVDIDIPAPLEAALKALDEWATTKDGLEHEPFAEQGQRVLADLSGFVERAGERTRLRGKVGRVLSAANRELLHSYLEQLDALSSKSQDIRRLLAETDPEVTKAASLAALADFELITARLNGVTI